MVGDEVNFVWDANVKYRMRLRISFDISGLRRTRVWIWEDGTPFSEESPVYNNLSAHTSPIGGYLGLMGSRDGCGRMNVYEEIMHSAYL
jgi:hypothetical protein